MKKLIFAILLLVGVSAQAQVTDITVVPNGSGEVTVTLANNATGVNYLNAFELSW